MKKRSLLMSIAASTAALTSLSTIASCSCGGKVPTPTPEPEKPKVVFIKVSHEEEESVISFNDQAQLSVDLIWSDGNEEPVTDLSQVEFSITYRDDVQGGCDISPDGVFKSGTVTCACTITAKHTLYPDAECNASNIIVYKAPTFIDEIAAIDVNVVESPVIFANDDPVKLSIEAIWTNGDIAPITEKSDKLSVVLGNSEAGEINYNEEQKAWFFKPNDKITSDILTDIQITYDNELKPSNSTKIYIANVANYTSIRFDDKQSQSVIDYNEQYKFKLFGKKRTAKPGEKEEEEITTTNVSFTATNELGSVIDVKVDYDSSKGTWVLVPEQPWTQDCTITLFATYTQSDESELYASCKFVVYHQPEDVVVSLVMPQHDSYVKIDDPQNYTYCTLRSIKSNDETIDLDEQYKTDLICKIDGDEADFEYSNNKWKITLPSGIGEGDHTLYFKQISSSKECTEPLFTYKTPEEPTPDPTILASKLDFETSSQTTVVDPGQIINFKVDLIYDKEDPIPDPTGTWDISVPTGWDKPTVSDNKFSITVPSNCKRGEYRITATYKDSGEGGTGKSFPSSLPLVVNVVDLTNITLTSNDQNMIVRQKEDTQGQAGFTLNSVDSEGNSNELKGDQSGKLQNLVWLVDGNAIDDPNAIVWNTTKEQWVWTIDYAKFDSNVTHVVTAKYTTQYGKELDPAQANLYIYLKEEQPTPPTPEEKLPPYNAAILSANNSFIDTTSSDKTFSFNFKKIKTEDGTAENITPADVDASTEWKVIDPDGQETKNLTIGYDDKASDQQWFVKVEDTTPVGSYKINATYTYSYKVETTTGEITKTVTVGDSINFSVYTPEHIDEVDKAVILSTDTNNIVIGAESSGSAKLSVKALTNYGNFRTIKNNDPKIKDWIISDSDKNYLQITPDSSDDSIWICKPTDAAKTADLPKKISVTFQYENPESSTNHLQYTIEIEISKQQEKSVVEIKTTGVGSPYINYDDTEKVSSFMTNRIYSDGSKSQLTNQDASDIQFSWTDKGTYDADVTYNSKKQAWDFKLKSSVKINESDVITLTIKYKDFTSTTTFILVGPGIDPTTQTDYLSCDSDGNYIYLDGDDLKNPNANIRIYGSPKGETSIPRASFNSPVIVNNSKDVIPAHFLDNCPSFNSNIYFPAHLKSIGSNFLYKCPLFNKTLDFSGCPDLTEIGDYFLAETPEFNSPIELYNCHLTKVGDYFMYNNGSSSYIDFGGWDEKSSYFPFDETKDNNSFTKSSTFSKDNQIQILAKYNLEKFWSVFGDRNVKPFEWKYTPRFSEIQDYDPKAFELSSTGDIEILCSSYSRVATYKSKILKTLVVSFAGYDKSDELYIVDPSTLGSDKVTMMYQDTSEPWRTNQIYITVDDYKSGSQIVGMRVVIHFDSDVLYGWYKDNEKISIKLTGG